VGKRSIGESHRSDRAAGYSSRIDDFIMLPWKYKREIKIGMKHKVKIGEGVTMRFNAALVISGTGAHGLSLLFLLVAAIHPSFQLLS
jgi:hypothetical protein